MTNGFVSPSSFLELAVQCGLLRFAEREISTRKTEYKDELNRPTMLYYSLVGNARGLGPKSWKGFVKFLLENGCDPNGVLNLCVSYDIGRLMQTKILTTESVSESEPPRSVSPEIESDQEESDASEKDVHDNEAEPVAIRETESAISEESDPDHAVPEPPSRIPPPKELPEAEQRFEDITIMHFALAIACPYENYDAHTRISILDMLRILVEGGGNANVQDYRNHWGSRENEAHERSAIHYLLYQSPSEENPFDDIELSRALSRCITSFLEHGADPNAVDSDGISILECALRICPPEFVKLLLEKGAKVTPKLLTESGAPIQDADGILDEPRWRRPDCYTHEARKIARRYNPDWPELEEDREDLEQQQQQQQQRNLLQNTKMRISTAIGRLGNLGYVFGKG
jgi:hypothetical protein